MQRQPIGANPLPSQGAPQPAPVSRLTRRFIAGRISRTLIPVAGRRNRPQYNRNVPPAKLLDKILSGRSDAAIGFSELCHLMISLGFEERSSGSHHIFRKSGIEERINLQKDGRHAKPYQVKQVRAVILKYKLGVPQ